MTETIGQLTVSLEAGAPIEELAEALARLAAVDGRREVQRAAVAILPGDRGRPVIDDAQAMAEAEWRFRAGEYKSLWAADRAVSAAQNGPFTEESDAQLARITRKRRAAKSISLT